MYVCMYVWREREREGGAITYVCWGTEVILYKSQLFFKFFQIALAN